MLGLNKNIVILAPYDENWAAEYEKEKIILDSILEKINYKIEHVGSTSIPGLCAKPIIDIALGVKDIQTIVEAAEILKVNGYYINNHIDEEEYIFAAKEDTSEIRTHHIHIEVINNKRWMDHTFFKRYLIEHPIYVSRYENFKKGLADKFFNDRKEYVNSKDVFISSILEKAYKLYRK